MKPKIDNRLFYRTVAALVIPMALQNLINVGITSVDVIMLGKVNETVLSGASLGGQVSFVMNLILFGLGSGSSVLIAQYWGKKDIHSIETIFGIAVKISLVVGLAFTVVTLLMPSTLMHIFTNDDAIIDEGAKYLRFVCFSYIISAMTMAYLNTMRGVECVMLATWTYLSSMITNIIVNWLLIFGVGPFPKLGVIGAALGTVIARIVELTIILLYNIYTKRPLRFHIKYMFRHNPLLTKDFMKYSVPVIGNELMWGLGMSAVAAVIGHLGQDAVAASSVVQVARQLAMVVGFGVASATAITIGKAIGEGNSSLAKIYSHKFLHISIATGILGAIVILIVRPIAMNIMSLSDNANSLLSFMMLIMAYYAFFQSVNTTLIVGVFRGGGDTVFGLFADITFMWGVSILCGFIAAFFLNLDVHIIYVTLLSDELVKFPFTWYRYHSGRWLNNVTR